MNERRMMAIAALALGAIPCLAGCPGEPPSADPPVSVVDTGGMGGSGGAGGGSTCGDVETTIFTESCGRCHSADHPQKGLDLVSPGLAARVVGQPAQGGCGGILADPQHPEASVLYEKLLDAPGCGARMPIGGSPLSADQIACVKEWIAAQ